MMRPDADGLPEDPEPEAIPPERQIPHVAADLGPQRPLLPGTKYVPQSYIKSMTGSPMLNPDVPTLHPSYKMTGAFQAITEAVGGREKAVEILTCLPLTPPMEMLCKLLADPSHSETSVAQLCGYAGVPLGRFIGLISEGRHQQAIEAARDTYNARIPQLAMDIVDNALSESIVCYKCHARPKKTPCQVCHGSGKIRIMAEHERQELAAKMVGLLPQSGKAPTTNIQLNQSTKVQAQGPQPLTTSPDFRRATDRLLYPGKYEEREAAVAPVDAEMVESEGESAE